MLPNFMIIGVAKCGTTTLCNTLEQHPDIFISQPKEPNYFNKAILYESSRDQYERIFEDAGNFSLRGEGSVGYTNPNRLHFIPRRIHEVIPDCRIVLMVRHPIKRLESDWKMLLREGNADQDFNEALQGDILLYNHGLYWKTLSKYLDYFEKEQILVVFLEDLNKSFDAEISRVLRHIGADTRYNLSVVHDNSAESYRRDTGFSSLLKKYLGNNIKSIVPDSLKNMFTRTITTKWNYDITWDPQIYEDVVKHFTRDSQTFLEYCGKSSDFWDFTCPKKK